ncbi:Na+/H+ antiporter NhaA [Bradyrhizobium sp. 83012]|uniref:Na(+)/H(+) antiporter NhaA n=1 Tax=Bradyrhizobium aeschynomenes TaxID=2734909 RepID=A0ABX2C5T4_9BRAD|nr:Na+/H+ antiporter NhaA [Bradyrhizobium aeschynomenes]NPU63636.1 Na+/H+ antiporter NhaA [Bradyrhizobium aeschynomenes]
MSRSLSSAFHRLVASQAGAGIILMISATAALIVANTPASEFYFASLQRYIAGLSVLHWINDALMAVFFLLVGLEIKREFLDGQLSTWPRRVLPAFAATGGMVVPALVYIGFNLNTAETFRGWAIPTATDIAFALGALALLGSRVPSSLKIFLTALAILDDLGAVTVIAVFYTDHLALGWLAAAGAVLAVLVVLNQTGVARLSAYLVLGAALWVFTLKSGVHATLAGVALAWTIPASPRKHAPLLTLEHAIQPWVAFAILPIFAFANAGVSLAGMSWDVLKQPVTLGIIAGLFVGKQSGILAATWLAIRLRLARLPEGADWRQVYGIAVLCGIGFTMSLFIGLLAFPGAEALQNEVKVGVLLGSLLSGLFGMALLSWPGRGKAAEQTI